MFPVLSLAQVVFDELSARKIAHSVGLDSAKYRTAKLEIERVSSFEGFRDKSATELELALGSFAFFLWMAKSMELRDPAFTQAANETARIVAINFISALTNAPTIVSFIRSQVPHFDPEREIALAIAKDNSPVWKNCLTRAVIMVCRSIVYEATGIMGGRLKFVEGMSLKEIGLVAFCMLAEALDENTAKNIAAPLGIL